MFGQEESKNIILAKILAVIGCLPLALFLLQESGILPGIILSHNDVSDPKLVLYFIVGCALFSLILSIGFIVKTRQKFFILMATISFGCLLIVFLVIQFVISESGI